ncbi:hypothetical protein PPSIR1_17835 [Plesiocystis pacifica SIR-1]|uniref:DNA binding HTH domain-containing protein n=1 Tax=Plesiocystis pacifica SIR-1 TaxID=391625 RepID=A6GIX1_9BACT|nr:hypothetical protein [Plesiocystis pacifica]EDM74168.1 hypothetical protein PPSIR1_17835 [Plesiocystis pacifica SIR-1]
MRDLAEVLLDISVVFADSEDFQELLPRLARRLERHLPVAEVEIAEYVEREDSVLIATYSPDSGRRWRGTRSRRYLSRRDGSEPRVVDLESGELSRIDYSEISVAMELPIGGRVLVSIRFTEMPVDIEGAALERLLAFLDAQLRCFEQVVLAELRCRDLEAKLAERAALPTPEAEPEPKTEMSVESVDPPESLDRAIAEHLRRALAHTGGKIYGEGGAAELLGLKPSTLQSKLRKHGIERSDFVEAPTSPPPSVRPMGGSTEKPVPSASAH